MNPSESSNPISGCSYKFVSGERKWCFISLHLVTCKTQVVHCIFWLFFLFVWNPFYASKWSCACSMEWSLEWLTDKFVACCLHRAISKPDSIFLGCFLLFHEKVPVSFKDKEVQAGVTPIFPYSLNAFGLNVECQAIES